MTELERVHRCQFCGKTFKRKSWFQRHTCAKKQKFEQTHDVVVQHAYRLFTYWMQLQNMIKRNKAPSIEKFLKSPLKNAFVRLVMFSREQGIVSPYSYVEWLVKQRIPEKNWCPEDQKAIDEYRQYAQDNEDPEDQALLTLNEIEKWMMDDTERTADQFFDNLSPGVILTMVRQRRIRPWVLFTYEPIASRWLDEDRYDADVWHRMDDLVNCTYWSDKVASEPDGIKLVKDVMDQVWDY